MNISKIIEDTKNKNENEIKIRETSKVISHQMLITRFDNACKLLADLLENSENTVSEAYYDDDNHKITIYLREEFIKVFNLLFADLFGEYRDHLDFRLNEDNGDGITISRKSHSFSILTNVSSLSPDEIMEKIIETLRNNSLELFNKYANR